MKKGKRIFVFILIAAFSFFINTINAQAEDITGEAKYYLNSEIFDNSIKDYNELTYIEVTSNDTIKITSEKNIAGIYIEYEAKSQTGILKNQSQILEVGKNGFLHEYIELVPTKELTIKYDKNVQIAEIFVLDENGCPDYIEKWNTPLDDKADLLVFPTHFDDDTLYLAGVIPTYVDAGKNVQIAYYTFNSPAQTIRIHEALHGLYKMGIRNYPVLGIIPDEFSEDLDTAIKNLEKHNLTIDDGIKFQVEMIRRFKPSVIAGHDENGEYGNGQHMLNTHTLKTAVEKAIDKNYHVESYAMYGIWNTPKTYIHAYKENPIVLDLDKPLKHFDGKTAYEIQILGFKEHKTQQTPGLLDWLLGTNRDYTKASEIIYYPPSAFGLYRSLVGNDVNKNDMFENIDLIVESDQTVENTNSKIFIPNLYNIITISLVVIAILLYFEMSPMRIYSLLLKLKDLIFKEIKNAKNRKNETRKSDNKIKANNKTKKKDTSKSKKATKKPSSKVRAKNTKSQEKTSTKKTNTKKNAVTKNSPKATKKVATTKSEITGNKKVASTKKAATTKKVATTKSKTTGSKKVATTTKPKTTSSKKTTNTKKTTTTKPKTTSSKKATNTKKTTTTKPKTTSSKKATNAKKTTTTKPKTTSSKKATNAKKTTTTKSKNKK